jgi:hypothetical protein
MTFMKNHALPAPVLLDICILLVEQRDQSACSNTKPPSNEVRHENPIYFVF